MSNQGKEHPLLLDSAQPDEHNSNYTPVRFLKPDRCEQKKAPSFDEAS